MTIKLLQLGSLVLALLCIPLLAMQFSGDVRWSVADFVLAGFLLFFSGLLVQFIQNKVSKRSWRIGLIFVVVFLLLLLWAELAVGLFDSPFAGN
jgi:predicted PurR-regulated permease PerM